jgi:hypothetical protein
VILAGSSKFFSRVLKQQQHPHPLLYMRGMTAGQLTGVVDFIYHGEVNILQEDLNEFLSLAEELGLKGLNETAPNNQKQSKKKPRMGQRKITSPSFTSLDITDHENVPKDESQSNVWQDLDLGLKTENISETSLLPEEIKYVTNEEDLDSQVKSMMEQSTDGKWSCRVCGKQTYKAHLKSHVEGKHIEGVSHLCGLCGKSFRSRPSLQNHTSVQHR